MAERVLVSGGSGGIGGALCVALAREGISPIVGYASGRDRAESVARVTGGETVALDLTDPEQIDAALSTLSGDPPIVGVVLAGAPPPSLARFGRLSRQELELQCETQVYGPQRLLAGAVQRWFRPARRGAVLGILSAAMEGVDSSSAMASMGAYLIGKYGLCGVLAAAGADYPWLAVRTVHPGFTDTPMLEAFDSRFVDGLREQGRVADVESVAKEAATIMIRAIREPEDLR